MKRSKIWSLGFVIYLVIGILFGFGILDLGFTPKASAYHWSPPGGDSLGRYVIKDLDTGLTYFAISQEGNVEIGTSANPSKLLTWGSLGIGTTEPGASKLKVEGDTTINGTLTASGGQIKGNLYTTGLINNVNIGILGMWMGTYTDLVTIPSNNTWTTINQGSFSVTPNATQIFLSVNASALSDAYATFDYRIRMGLNSSFSGGIQSATLKETFYNEFYWRSIGNTCIYYFPYGINESTRYWKFEGCATSRNVTVGNRTISMIAIPVQQPPGLVQQAPYLAQY
jgi:hypothetical protein